MNNEVDNVTSPSLSLTTLQANVTSPSLSLTTLQAGQK